MARSLIAFTGGLDSTYVLEEELKKGHEVEVMYGAVSQCEQAIIAEITCRRRILEHFYKKYPNQIKDEWVNINIPVHISQIPIEEKRPQIVQQSNTMMALLQVILSSEVSWYRPMVGWHYQDVLEGDPNQGTSEESLFMLKDSLLPLLRLMDPRRRGSISKLMTPAWSIEKIDMWNSLDEWTQKNICLDYWYSYHDRGDGNLLMSAGNFLGGGSPKFAEYAKMGINVVKGVSASYGLLTDLDRFFIAKKCVGECRDLTLVKQCVKRTAPVLDIFALSYAVNPVHLNNMVNYKLQLSKGTS